MKLRARVCVCVRDRENNEKEVIIERYEWIEGQ